MYMMILYSMAVYFKVDVQAPAERRIFSSAIAVSTTCLSCTTAYTTYTYGITFARQRGYFSFCRL
ncbi:hypothetical protein LMG27177_06960 [Paraburkholderia fynbosensis]|uniref:Uncharacterized protein n=1 Tax=Paraburkholderia fynbosensis TaxID=1200993 RepID=A0A6J5H175_9BURK|nr:hypothetical protein LMG27177_06960 [Paraburkholderia fynbosensis]